MHVGTLSFLGGSHICVENPPHPGCFPTVDKEMVGWEIFWRVLIGNLRKNAQAAPSASLFPPPPSKICKTGGCFYEQKPLGLCYVHLVWPEVLARE